MSTFLMTLILAGVISGLTIQGMSALAPQLGLIDAPDIRKIHAQAVPRVGGWGIVLGTLGSLIPLLLGSESHWLGWYWLGGVILLLVGGLDDRLNLSALTKLLGQMLAITPVVILGDISIQTLPFAAQTLPEPLADALTIFGLVGVVNALNMSDGLDGLASGETLLSAIALGTLAVLAGDGPALLIILALVGSLFGFLYFNTYPARLFMGDSGSQFLGYTLGLMAIYLVQQGTSDEIPISLGLFIIGLPIIDTLTVMWQRHRYGQALFTPTKSHLHHRLLALNLSHSQAVVLLYGVQAVFVISGLLMHPLGEMILLLWYLVLCGLIFLGINYLERHSKTIAIQRAQTLEPSQQRVQIPVLIHDLSRRPMVSAIYCLGALFVFYILLNARLHSVALTGYLSIGLIFCLLPLLSIRARESNQLILNRLMLFGSAGMTVFLTPLIDWREPVGAYVYVDMLCLTLMFILILISWHQTKGGQAQLLWTPSDYLIGSCLLLLGILAAVYAESRLFVFVVAKLVILLYSAEVLIQQLSHPRRIAFPLAGMMGLMLIFTGVAP